MKMNTMPALLILAIAMCNLPGAHAEGCAKGAVVGGVAGHVLGHHAVLGAVAGCIIGHHQAETRKREQQKSKLNTSQERP